MEIKQFRYAADNFAYLVAGRKQALAIDGGAVEEILTLVDGHDLDLTYVANTHSHPDHTIGTQELVRRSGSQYLDYSRLMTDGVVQLGGESVRVLHTPGHTQDSLTFVVDRGLIAGDTLFNGTVGNCYSGDLKRFYESIKTLSRFPDDTLVYAGHDYVYEAIAFARALEPANGDLDRYLERYDRHHVCSTLGQEREVNPYLRFNQPSLIEVMKQRGLTVDTEYERWLAVMSI